MIGLFDTLTLAVAKLKTRRIMMFITVLVAGLMFSVLFAATLIISGALDSFARFDQASDQSFLVQVHSLDHLQQQHLNSFGEDNKQAKAEAERHYQLYVKEQKELAKQHKIDFDEKSVQHPLKKYKFGSDSIHYQYNYDSPVVERILLERQKKFIAEADNNLAGLKKRAAPFNPVNFYQTSGYRNIVQGLKFIQGDKEDLFNKLDQELKGGEPSEASVRMSNYRFEESIVMKNLILPANDLRRQNPQAVPIVISAEEAQILFGKKLNIAKVPTDNKQLLKWIEETQTKINGQTYQVCYRNTAEQRLLDEALSQHIVREKTDDEPELPKPKILYNLPTKACGRVTIKEDKRTREEKKQDEARTAIAKQQGLHQEPASEILTFQVVGIFPPRDSRNDGGNITGLLNHLLNNQIYPGAVVPLDFYRKLPNKASLDQVFFPKALNDKIASSGQLLQEVGFGPVVVEFSNYQDANNFMDFISGHLYKNYNNPNQGLAGLFFGNPKDYYKNKTVDTSKYKFFATTHGRDFGTLEFIKRQSKIWVAIIITIISGIAAIILSLTMARVMSDSRHETAIFRAVGARRGDIAKIYLSYSLIIAVRIILVALVLGLIISLIINSKTASDLTIQAKLGYGLFNQNLDFKLFGLNPIWLGVLSLAIVVMSLVAVIPPMLRNVVRNPIKDIKDQ